MLIIIFLVIAAAVAAIYVHMAGAMTWKCILLFAACFIALNLVYILFFCILSIFVDNSKPLNKQSPICRLGVSSILGLLLHYAMVRTHLIGVDKLPTEGRFVFVSNHRSAFDPLVALVKLNKYEIGFISKPSNMRLPVVGKLAHGIGCIAIDREHDRNALKSILQAIDYIKRDVCTIGIYPEGTRSVDGEMLAFHAGSFKIAQKAGVPLAVACVRGTENIKKNALRRVSDVYLEIIELIPAERVKAMSSAELAEYSRGLIEARLAAEVG